VLVLRVAHVAPWHDEQPGAVVMSRQEHPNPTMVPTRGVPIGLNYVTGRPPLETRHLILITLLVGSDIYHSLPTNNLTGLRTCFSYYPICGSSDPVGLA
jgi:hypothetical protein